MSTFTSLVTGLVVALLVGVAELHPQCLDSGAPFKLEKALFFCPSSTEYGCCRIQRDLEIYDTHRQIMSSFNLRSGAKCTKLLREVLCLECHPYAAHIFASEGNKMFDINSATPGLCYDFCQTFFEACSHVVRIYFLQTGIWAPLQRVKGKSLARFARISKREFCRSITLPDRDYCYPDVKNIDQKILERKYNRKSNEGCVCARPVASSLRNPLAATHAGDGTNRLFVVEQLGEVQVYLANGTRLAEPFLDIKEKVLTSNNFADERGLLGLAFHPNYSSNGRVFVYYSADAGGRRDEFGFRFNHMSVLSEYRVYGNEPNRVNKSSEKIILEVSQPAANHNGGQLFFGTDGYLYLSLGDGGLTGDPFGNGLDRSTLLGSIIRIDINTRDGSPYKIPADNPFINTRGMRPEIFAYGARNMWRCSVDRGDKDTQEGRGRIFCGDVGQNRFEEIDIIVKGGNYGWRAFEGFSCYDRELCKGELAASAIPPIFAYNHTVGKSVVGGFVYRGCRNPNLYGKYMFADTWSGELFLLTEDKNTGKWRERVMCFGDRQYCTDGLVGGLPRYILSFGEDEQGEVYILATNFPDAHYKGGKVYRLVDPARRGNPSKCKNEWYPFTKRRRRKPCVDKWSSRGICARYRSRGWCQKYQDFFKHRCRKTCNFCE